MNSIGKLITQAKFSIGEGVFTSYWNSMKGVTHAPLGPGKYLCVDGHPLIELKGDVAGLFLNPSETPSLEVKK